MTGMQMNSDTIDLPAQATSIENLPAIIDRASSRLMEARSSAEVLEAKAIAEAALHYAKITKAANETHADCIRIITRAEMRMANEIDAAKERGDIKTQSDNQHVRSSGKLGFEDLGIDRRRVSEWRDIRDAGEEVVEGAIQKALAEGRAPTKSEILADAKAIRAEKSKERYKARIIRISEVNSANAPLPVYQKYSLIYADPPWDYELYNETTGSSRAASEKYPTMKLEDICALPVDQLATKDAVLFMWTTSPHLRESFTVLDSWGFEYKTHVVWVKHAIGLGHYVRGQHEHLIIATRGDFPAPLPANRPSSVIAADRRNHSQKPDEAYELIETMYPDQELPKIELFARQARPGWACWGNQAPTSEQARLNPQRQAGTELCASLSSGRTKLSRPCGAGSLLQMNLEEKKEPRRGGVQLVN
jgi:N6-adenosine-specific RNA methylase IME4